MFQPSHRNERRTNEQIQENDKNNNQMTSYCSQYGYYYNRSVQQYLVALKKY